MPFLDRLEICNFKSYLGFHVIGPIKSLNGIVGPNGNGKSNIVDAIAFATAEKICNLRVQNLSDLISETRRNTESTFVILIFKLDNGDEMSFKVTILNEPVGFHSTQYEINDEIRTLVAYKSQLENLGLNLKTQNHIIYQGTIEVIATLKAQERTKVFENLCQSIELKSNYDRYKKRLEKLELDLKCTIQAKTFISINKRKFSREAKAAKNYNDLQQQYLEKQIYLRILELYSIERNIEKLERFDDETRDVLQSCELARKALKDELTNLGNERTHSDDQLKEVREHQREKSILLEEKKAKLMKITTDINCHGRPLESANTRLIKAKKDKESHVDEIKKLETELDLVKQIREDLISPDSNIELDSDQETLYAELKVKYLFETEDLRKYLQPLRDQLGQNENDLENNRRKEKELNNSIKWKREGRKNIQHRIDTLKKSIKEIEDNISKKKTKKTDLQDRIAQIDVLKNKIQANRNVISEAVNYVHTDPRMRKQAHVVEILKTRFQGVHGRLINLCEVVHPRYKIAAAKIIGNNVNAIIIDNVETASECIEFLMKGEISYERFLPFDSLNPEPLKESLRNKAPNVKLLYDVLKFSTNIEKAILFVTHNTLVCETQEDAKKFAYESGSTYYDTVSIEGISYSRAGILSISFDDTRKKANQWHATQIAQLKSEQKQLELQYRKDMGDSPNEIKFLDNEIGVLKNKLKYLQDDLTNSEKQVRDLDEEIEKLEIDLDLLNGEKNSVEEEIKRIKKKANKIEEKIQTHKDKVFRNFCQDIGINNIREYEQGKLLAHFERKKKQSDCEKQFNRIENLLKMEKERDMDNDISRWESVKNDFEQKLTRMQEDKRQLDTEIEHIEKEIESFNITIQIESNEAIKRDIRAKENQINKINREFNKHQAALKIIQSDIETKQFKWKRILENCLMESISIPIVKRTDGGNLPDDSILSNSDELDYESIKINFEEFSKQCTLNFDELDEDKLNDIVTQAKADLAELNSAIESMEPTNQNTDEQMRLFNLKWKEAHKKETDIREMITEVRDQFNAVQFERSGRINEFLDGVNKEIASVYQTMVNNSTVEAYLIPENAEEPYLGGIEYSVIAVGKHLRAMPDLSGGEKTLAALALVFAIHSFKPSPFIVLDEIDAALDRKNLKNFIRYICLKKHSLRLIMISHNLNFIYRLDTNFGIYRNPATNASAILSLPLEVYHEITPQNES